MKIKFIKTESGNVFLQLQPHEERLLFISRVAGTYLQLEPFKAVTGEVFFLASCMVVNPVTLVNKHGYYDINGSLVEISEATAGDILTVLRITKEELTSLRLIVAEQEKTPGCYECKICGGT
jgi:hypothetical protein